MKRLFSSVLCVLCFIIGIYLLVDGISIGGKAKHKRILDMSVEDRANYLIDNCKTLTYEEIARNPDNFKNDLVVFTGEVIQVQDSILLVNVTYNGDEYYSYYTDTVYVKYKFADNLKILDGDIITLYGEILGEKDYISVLGQKMTVPQIVVYYAVLNEKK